MAGGGESLHCGTPSQSVIYLELTLTGHTLQPDHAIQLFTGIQPFQQIYGGVNSVFCTLEDLISHFTQC